MADAIASAKNVTMRFHHSGPAVLENVAIEIEAGKMTGLVGPDGAGKTTLIRIFAGLIVPEAGEVLVLGRPALQAERAEIGYMPQRFGLYEDLTVRENLELYADLRGLKGGERQAGFDRLLGFTDLKRFTDRLAGDLSGGMKQKLGLACALLRQPKLLLLDEPGVGVDPVSRRELWDLVRSLIGEGVAVLWSTSYLDEAERCDKVTLLHEGRPLYSGPPAALSDQVAGRVFRLPVAASERRPSLRRLLGEKAVLDGVIQGSSLRLLLHEKASPKESALGALAEHMKAVPPRLEDAYVDALGGGPKGASKLALSYGEVRANDKPAIVAERLTKRFGDFVAADAISFEVPRGQIFGLLGPNGAGKSTTFKMLCGLLTPSSGTGSVAGFDLRRANADARQSLGYMAQKFSLYGDLSVAQNLDFFAGAYGLGRVERNDAVARAIEIFHLEAYLGQNSGGLPLGFKQRLALACAVLHQPPVLFLDEPTSGVDPIVRREFWTHINGLVERGVTALVTTHFMEEAEYCDRIALIYRAQEIAQGGPDDLKARAREESGLEDPTLEDAFAALIREFDKRSGHGRRAA
jgi:ABC-2 type transport system ATP-binding protein